MSGRSPRRRQRRPPPRDTRTPQPALAGHHRRHCRSRSCCGLRSGRPCCHYTHRSLGSAHTGKHDRRDRGHSQQHEWHHDAADNATARSRTATTNRTPNARCKLRNQDEGEPVVAKTPISHSAYEQCCYRRTLRKAYRHAGGPQREGYLKQRGRHKRKIPQVRSPTSREG